MSDYPRPACLPQPRPTFVTDRWVAAAFLLFFLVMRAVRLFHFTQQPSAYSVFGSPAIEMADLVLSLGIWLPTLFGLSQSRRWPFFVALFFSVTSWYGSFRLGDPFRCAVYSLFFIYCILRLFGLLRPKPKSR
jgi:hypothetical protein